MFRYEKILPAAALNDYVEAFWQLEYTGEEPLQVVVLPDGWVDINQSVHPPSAPYLIGLDTQPAATTVPPGFRLFAISLKLPSIPFLLKRPFPDLADNAWPLTDVFPDAMAFYSFENFVSGWNNLLLAQLSPDPDPRVLQLFHLLYENHGNLSIAAMADQLHWSPRQINRYFQHWFGLPLKTYSKLLRFRAAFPDIKNGKLYPSQNFTDQAHFIREVKQFSGATPSVLKQNKNDRFIQFSALPPE